MDVGQSLNPAIDVGQIEGAFMQGYGLFTMEELVYGPNGTLYTRGPGTYKIPGFSDIPKEFTVSLLKGSANPRAVYSSKVYSAHKHFVINDLTSRRFFAGLGRRRTAVVFIGFGFLRHQKRRVLGKGTRRNHRVFQIGRSGDRGKDSNVLQRRHHRKGGLASTCHHEQFNYRIRISMCLAGRRRNERGAVRLVEHYCLKRKIQQNYTYEY